MNKKRLLKIITGLGVGLGIGACFAAAMKNIAGLLFGLGIGLCFAVAFSSEKKDGDK